MSDRIVAVIGLEVHVQLATVSKIFCSDSTAFGAKPNSQTSPVSLAHPGTLPILNERALELAISMGLAFDCTIADQCMFDRKHYFYPDSPKGYQITQQTLPVCLGGRIELTNKEGNTTYVLLEKIHLEDDAGKSIHEPGIDHSLIDLNRAGMPLIEIVTRPVIISADQAGQVLEEIRRTVRYLGVSNGNMEEGSMRCDANISVKFERDSVLGNKVELKNLNSINHVRKALKYEFDRQSGLLGSGQEVVRESRLFKVDLGITDAMREKEGEDDYRYFPDPDLPAWPIDSKWVSSIAEKLADTPAKVRKILRESYSLNSYDIDVLTSMVLTKDLFFQLVNKNVSPQIAANWINGPIRSLIKQAGGENIPSPAQLQYLISLVENKKLPRRVVVKNILPQLFQVRNTNIQQLVSTYLSMMDFSDESDLEKKVVSILNEFPQKVEEYRKGKKSLLQLFMGELMRRTKGNADPVQGSKLFKQHLAD